MQYPNVSKLVAAAAMTAAGALVLAGCSAGTEAATATPEDVNITFGFWGSDDRAARTEQAIALFEESHPNISVEVSYADFDSYTQRLTTQAAGGGLPDVFAVPSELLVQFSESGTIVDMASLDPGVNTADIAEQYLAAATIDDTLWGVPLGRAASAFIYNPDVWAAAGLKAPDTLWTFDDLRDASKAIVDSTGGATVGVTDFGKFIEYFQIYLISQGKVLYTADGDLGFDENDLEDYWSITTGLVSDGLATDAQVTSLFDGSMETSPLVAGTSAAELGAASLIGAYDAALGTPVAAAAIPTAGDQSGLYAGVTSTAAIAAGGSDQQKAAAAEFLDFFINDVEAGKVLGFTRGLPPSQVVADAISGDLQGSDLTLYEYDKSIADVLQPAPPIFPAGVATVKPEFTRIYEDLSFGRLSVADAAAQAFKTFNDNL